MCDNDMIQSRCSYFFFSSRRRHTRCSRDWSSDVCSSDLYAVPEVIVGGAMELIGAGLHSEADDAVAGFAKLWGEITLKDLKLLDGVRRNAFVPLRIRRN